MRNVEKKCFKCDKVKSLSHFYKHKAMLDGHVNKCKDCNKKDVADHRLKNIERIRAYDRDRGSRQDKYYLREYRSKNKNKYKAHRMISNAIKNKTLFSQDTCELCSSNFHIEAHHDDYSKPLDVRWLCSACHKQWHAKNGEGLNGC